MNSTAASPMLTCSWSMSGLFVVDETLAVYPDGQAWLWSLYPAYAARRDQVGTFFMELGAEELEQVTAMAALLAETAPASPAWPPDRVSVRVTSHTDGHETAHLLFPGDRGMPGHEAEALATLDDLLRRVSACPYSAVSMGWTPLDPHVREGLPATHAYVFTSLGTQPVSLLLDASTLVLYARVDTGAEEWWRSDTPSPMGLLDDEIRLLDGITAPATIPPGALGRLVFAGALRAPRSGNAALTAQVEGLLALAGPQEQDFPAARFRLQSPETPLNVEPR